MPSTLVCWLIQPELLPKKSPKPNHENNIKQADDDFLVPLLIEEFKHRGGELYSSLLFIELDKTVFFQEARHYFYLKFTYSGFLHELV